MLHQRLLADLDVQLVEVELQLRKVREVLVLVLELLVVVRKEEPFQLEDLSFGVGAPTCRAVTTGASPRPFGKAFVRVCFGCGPSCAGCGRAWFGFVVVVVGADSTGCGRAAGGGRGGLAGVVE